MFKLRSLCAVIGLSWLVGCSSVQVPKISKELASLNPHEAWKKVLAAHVDDFGRVDFKRLQKDPGNLEVYVEYVSRISPKSNPELFKTPQDRLAFYINSYNALSMYNILDSDIPESLSGLKKVKFFFLKKMTIGGEKMSLYAYENDIIRKQGDERVHFALNCMSKGCPRLPPYPFVGVTLDKELDKQARFFFSEDRNISVDREKKELRLSEILKFYTEDFLRKKPNLAAYANQYRAAQVPEDYKISFIDYDWLVNSQPQSSKGLTYNTVEGQK